MSSYAVQHQRRIHIRFPSRAVFLAVMIVVCLFPILWTAVASLGIKIDSTVSPPTWSGSPSLDQYIEVGIAEPQFIVELLTSTSLSVLTALLTVAVAFLAAYSITHAHFRGRNLVSQIFLILASLPVVSYLIPLRNTLDILRLSDTFTGITLAETALFAPLATYVLYGYLSRQSGDVEEAARLDGATALHIMWRVVIPIAAPGVAATAIIVFVLSWNQLLIPLVLTARLRTIPTAMIDFFTFERELDWPTAAAALLVSLVPIGLLVAALHRSLERFSLGVSAQDDL